MNRTKNFFNIFEGIQKTLLRNGICFTKEGYPIFHCNFILQNTPNHIIPFNHKNSSKEKSKTALCYFMNDKLLYTRLSKLPFDIALFKDFMGVCGFDLSPRIGWDIDLQKFNIYLSQMATIYLALHGIKIIPNFRIGDISTISCLDAYPKNMPFALGALGCHKKKITTQDLLYLKMKIMYAEPSILYIYGKIEDECLKVIEDMGVKYKIFEDFRTSCYKQKEVL